VKRSIRNASLGILAATLLFTTVACSSDESATTAATAEATATTNTGGEAAGNVVDVAVSAGSFTVLTELLTAAGLVETLSGPGPFTVFAPTDEAFKAVAARLEVSPDNLVETLIADPELLTDMLLYHVVPGNLPASEVAALNGQRVETLSGEAWTVIVDGETVSIKDGFDRIANVIDVDVAASNGVIHVIDRVLEGALPDFGSDYETSTATTAEATPYTDTFDGSAGNNVVDVAVSAGSFTVLAKLLTAAGLVETLSGPGPFTVFAPTDEAFEEVAAQMGVNLEDLINTLIANPELLTDILLYHVVPGNLPATEVAALNGQKVETLSGEAWTVIVDGQTVSIKDGFDRTANVIDVDVAASNGVIHVIDRVLQGASPDKK
jgi:transforming growth factor-beta-induced protein